MPDKPKNTNLSSEQIRDIFLDFHKSNGHKEVPNVSLVPNVDSTLLFVNSGMFPLAKYLSGQPHPLGKRLTNIQRCLRTKYDEMLEIGDNRHTLMFEMMGNWSLGDYTKTEQILWVMELHVEHYGLDPHRIYASVWAGDDLVPRDQEAIDAWKKAFKKYGIDAEFSEDLTNIPKDLASGDNHKAKIFPYGMSDNWWKRGDAPGELGGPSSEIFYDRGVIERKQSKYHINDDSGRFLEIGNSVFMEYYYDDEMNWKPLKNKNIDFGGGFERVVMCMQDKTDIFETDLYEPILAKIAQISGKEYKTTQGIQEETGTQESDSQPAGQQATNPQENDFTASFRVLADHSRAATFILADGIIPSNKDQGYILRRFIRRLVRFGLKLEIEKNFTGELAKAVISRMKSVYPHLEQNRETILQELEKEEIKFRQTLSRGLKELTKLKQKKEKIDGQLAFHIYETFGFPLELILDELNVNETSAEKITQAFQAAEKAHREQSRAGAEQKFKGGLADKTEATIRLHTAHHLLLQALRNQLGEHVKQKGSNITGERLRIDLSHSEKISPEDLLKVEEQVNTWIKNSYDVLGIEMARELAEKLGAQMEFGQKYGDIVSVYIIGKFNKEFMDNLEGDLKNDFKIKDPNSFLEQFEQNEIISSEFCGGPHVANTSEIGESGQFKILKEQSSGSGIRRIKATLTR